MATSTEWTNSGLVDQLRRAAKEIADEGLPGWGNICSDAADLIERLSDGPSDRKSVMQECIEICEHVEKSLRDSGTPEQALGAGDCAANIRLRLHFGRRTNATRENK